MVDQEFSQSDFKEKLKVAIFFYIEMLKLSPPLESAYAVPLFTVDREEAALCMEGQFVTRVVYDDSLSYDLVGAASKILSKSNSFTVLW